MDIALRGRFFAHHNKKSHGQNCYHVVNSIHPDENNNIGLIYCAVADIDSLVYGCLATVHKVGLTAAILFHLRVEQLGSPWFLTAAFNHILKTLIDNISKTSRVNPQTTGIWCRKHLFSKILLCGL